MVVVLNLDFIEKLKMISSLDLDLDLNLGN